MEGKQAKEEHSMAKVKMLMGGMIYTFECGTPSEVVFQMNQTQDFRCLLFMGRRMETGKHYQNELDKLEAFCEKWGDGELIWLDIRQLCIDLSIGSIMCLEVTDIPQEELEQYSEGKQTLFSSGG